MVYISRVFSSMNDHRAHTCTPKLYNVTSIPEGPYHPFQSLLLYSSLKVTTILTANTTD